MLWLWLYSFELLLRCPHEAPVDVPAPRPDCRHSAAGGRASDAERFLHGAVQSSPGGGWSKSILKTAMKCPALHNPHQMTNQYEGTEDNMPGLPGGY